jgi:hypothetical protein
MHSSDENLENATYCNQLTSELLQLIQLQHKGFTFKGIQYENKQKLRVNMAKYYVKAFQIYSALQVIENIDIFGFHNITIEELKYIPVSVITPTTSLHVAYNYLVELKIIYEIKTMLLQNLDRMIKNNTFLLSLEEMDSLVIDTKEKIKFITYPKKMLNTIELYNEKKIIEELKKYFL